jgi:hypothetical protein
MSKILKCSALALAMSIGVLAAPAQAADKAPPAAAKAPSADAKAIEKHLRDHQKYPATKAELVAECGNLSDFSETDKKWFTDKLPEGTYASAEAVMKAIGLKK